jgi:hypothetical protein
MSGIAMTPDSLNRMAFSDPCLNTAAALIVEDFRKDEFDTIEKVRQLKKLQIAIPSLRASQPSGPKCQSRFDLPGGF